MLNLPNQNTETLQMQQGYKAVLISIHPRYVNKILDGSKKVEFRRVWAAQQVTHLVIYSTSPDMKVVATVEIAEVVRENQTNLWETAKKYGGGLTRKELRAYFSVISKGYALVLKKTNPLKKPLNLSELGADIRAPQSYSYLTADQFLFVQSQTNPEE